MDRQRPVDRVSFGASNRNTNQHSLPLIESHYEPDLPHRAYPKTISRSGANRGFQWFSVRLLLVVISDD